jgi:hypothetical protein
MNDKQNVGAVMIDTAETDKFTAMKVPRQYPFFLLLNVC